MYNTTEFKNIIASIRNKQDITKEQLEYILNYKDDPDYLYQKASEVAQRIYNKEVYLRGLIEFTNYCRNDCYYCGIRCSNFYADRYRMSKEDILACCKKGYELGFRTFVLQGGEDNYYNDDMICDIVRQIKQENPGCAVTLSIGEKSHESYLEYFNAGADRYLLRHETANKEHYEKLHPQTLSCDNRKKCLKDLKEIGYQVGCGIMVGTPHQTVENIYEDICFMKELKPHMIGIGPFIPHKDTPFANEPMGSVELTLKLLSILRLIFPDVLLPATTALGTADVSGREKGILAGANVLMPNLSPVDVRDKYLLYDGKICTGEESAECIACLKGRIEKIGYHLSSSRGDHPAFCNR